MTNFETDPAKRVLGWLATAALLLLVPGAAQAQEANEVPDLVLMEREAPELADRLDMPPDRDPDLADTALVITNLGNRRIAVRCWAFNGNGKPIGRTGMTVPALGVRWILASDLSNDRDFIGSAHCYVTGPAKGTAVFLGPGITDLPAGPIPESLISATGQRVVFPLVAHY